MREKDLTKLKTKHFDVLILGGGINGAVSAASLSAQGLAVALIDKGDFASCTSQYSSNLIWGGIKYLENMELFLVRKLCNARNHLIKTYPSLVKETRFLSPHKKDFKHGLYKLYLGTWFYWLIGSCFTSIPKFFTIKRINHEEPVIELDNIDGGFEYSDAMLPDNDARFTFQFIKQAHKSGAITINYIESLKSVRQNKLWLTEASDNLSNEKFTIKSKAIINATGPFVDSININNNIATRHKHILSKGAHIVVKKIASKNRILTFFADDNRMFFVIPMGNRSNIGTTDTLVETPDVEMTNEDRLFILNNINKRLKLSKPLTLEDIISERCGVRPLVVKTSKHKQYDDFLKLSRKHVLESNIDKQYISIFGGKLTDCLNIGEELINKIKKMGFKIKNKRIKWYGEPDLNTKKKFIEEFCNLDLSINKLTLSEHLWKRYLDDAYKFIELIKNDISMAEKLFKDQEYIKAEIIFVKKYEFVEKPEDFFRRRSNLAMLYRKKDLDKISL